MGDAGSGQGRVRVHFVTNSPDIELPESKRQLLVPTGQYHTVRALLNPLANSE